MQRVTPHLFQIPLGGVNCFVIDGGEDGLVLIDTGYKKSKEKIFAAIKRGGKSPQDISHIVLTHTHPDHAGSAAAIAKETGAIIIAHAEDAALAEQGIAGRLPHILSPGLVHKIIFRLFIKNTANAIPAFTTDSTVGEGDIIPVLDGLRVVHTPGHSAGHIALHFLKDDVLIAGDLCANMIGLGLSTVYEDRALGIRSILKTVRTPFDNAVFGHGNPILRDAARKIGEKFVGMSNEW